MDNVLLVTTPDSYMMDIVSPSVQMECTEMLKPEPVNHVTKTVLNVSNITVPIVTTLQSTVTFVLTHTTYIIMIVSTNAQKVSITMILIQNLAKLVLPHVPPVKTPPTVTLVLPVTYNQITLALQLAH